MAALKESHVHMAMIVLLVVVIILMIVHISKMYKKENFSNKFDLLGSSTAASTAIMDSVLEYGRPAPETTRLIQVAAADGINLLAGPNGGNSNNMIGPITPQEIN